MGKVVSSWTAQLICILDPNLGTCVDFYFSIIITMQEGQTVIIRMGDKDGQRHGAERSILSILKVPTSLFGYVLIAGYVWDGHDRGKNEPCCRGDVQSELKRLNS